MAQVAAAQIYGRKNSKGVNWITVIAMTAFHIGAVAAFFYFDWGAIIAMLALWYISGSWGIGMGYHRLLTHRGYKTPKWVEYFLTICGTLALEGGPIFWVATHRIHHQNSDHEGDPHSPREGTYWAHMGWIMTGKAMHHDTNILQALRAGSQQGPLPRRAHHLALGAAGGRRTGILLAFGGWPYVLWGVFFRTTFGLHARGW
jgi:sn-1 stearoyl-lipid 9-desaturase